MWLVEEYVTHSRLRDVEGGRLPFYCALLLCRIRIPAGKSVDKITAQAHQSISFGSRIYLKSYWMEDFIRYKLLIL